MCVGRTACEGGRAPTTAAWGREPSAQKELLRSPAAALLGDVDVLKVAHHIFS